VVVELVADVRVVMVAVAVRVVDDAVLVDVAVAVVALVLHANELQFCPHMRGQWVCAKSPTGSGCQQ
jgi:hypothetical protein